MSNIKVICDRDDLVAIADGFRTSRGITNNLNLGDMATLAYEKVGGGSVEIPTCTVTFHIGEEVYAYGDYCYTKYED